LFWARSVCVAWKNSWDGWLVIPGEVSSNVIGSLCHSFTKTIVSL
jgi:hypothetical protein